MKSDYRKGFATGLAMKPLYVTTDEGSGVIPDLDLTGINGLFIPDTRDVENGLWRNAIPNGNDMILTGGSINDEAMRLPSGEYGDYTCPEPNTVYTVVKTNAPIELDVNPIITKLMRSSRDLYGFDLRKAQDYNRGNYDVLSMYGLGNYYSYSKVSSLQYHVVCYTRPIARDPYGCFYIDGVFAAPYMYYPGYYAGSMRIGSHYDSEYTPAYTVDMIMCAFGTEYHEEFAVVRNSILLSAMYGIDIGLGGAI